MASHDFPYLLKILRRLERGPAPYFELKEYLRKDDGEGEALHQRSFQRYIRRIEENFGTTVVYNRSTKKYEIEESGKDAHRTRLLEAYELAQALRTELEASPYILFEARKPKGMEHFAPLLAACKARKAILLTYQKFGEWSARERAVSPWALKESQGRWYLLAYDSLDGRMKLYGLDRVRSYRESKEGFLPCEGELDRLFDEAFGAYNPDYMRAENIVLWFAKEQVPYALAFPLHPSQKLGSLGEEGTHFKLRLKPTFDFIKELLSHGERVEVISPKSLREEMKLRLQAAASKY